MGLKRVWMLLQLQLFPFPPKTRVICSYHQYLSIIYIYILAFATVKSAEAYDLSADGKSLHCGERGGEMHETYFIICHQFSFRSVETKRRLYCQAALAVPVAGANWEWTRGERHVIVSLHRGYPLRNSGVKHGIQWIGVRDEYIILMPACAQTPRPGTRGFHWLGQQVPDAMLGWGSWVIQIWFNGSFPVTPFFLKKKCLQLIETIRQQLFSRFSIFPCFPLRIWI